ncbi:type II secretion system protein GspG [Leucothrix sargassi]|nr:type II secretion system protein GspG [Leucothrix sargassi]
MRTTKMRRLSLQKGFTLLEIIVVVTIIAIIGAIVAPNIIDKFSGVQEDVARTEIKRIKATLGFYKLENFNLPSTEQGLQALVTKPSGTPAPSARWKKQLDAVPVDPWGNPYQYLNPGTHDDIDIFSYGPDGTKSDDDIGSWQLQ